MREPRASPNFDRIWRLVALFALCGLIYYFSFDNGRQTSKARIARLQEHSRRLEADNESLALQVGLLRREVASLRAGGAGAGPGGSADGGTGTAAPGGAGQAALAGAGLAADGTGRTDTDGTDRAGTPPYPSEEAPGAFIGDAGASALAAGPDAAGQADGTAGAARAGSAEPTLTRLNVRSDESRLLLGGQVLVSVDAVDSLDRTAVVRVHELDANRREARTMEPGDSLVIERGGAEHRLLLDQLKGSQAVFLLISP
ncbi:MAG: hypothetical protein LBT40_08275 [Deltaproteobacteria bacterium]|jgi:hypothetical protein|nr:hypothetical protein [Deltaproteobacteria bacterium]